MERPRRPLAVSGRRPRLSPWTALSTVALLAAGFAAPVGLAADDSFISLKNRENAMARMAAGLRESPERFGVSPERAERTAAILENRAAFLPPGMDLRALYNYNYCARVVALTAARLYGDDQAAAVRGISGNAWELSRNIAAAGGRIFSLPPAGTEPPQDEEAVRVGDIFGIYYRDSTYITDSDHETEGDQPNPVGYTHVALIIAIDKTYGPIIVHRWIPPQSPEGTWPIRVENLDSLLEGFPGLFEPRVLMRPIP